MNSLPKSNSEQLYSRAVKVMPGGISRNTIFRLPNPDYAKHGKGCVVTDVDGVDRIDFSNNMCSLIHGHAHQPTIEAVSTQLQNGTAFTLATEAELKLAEHLCNRGKGFEKIRFMNSGTEAVMSAIKLARAVTGLPKIAKTEGAYHGTYDYAEISQKSQPNNWGDCHHPNPVAVAHGTPQSALQDVLVFPFNDVEKTLALLEENKADLAAVILDLLPHRVGVIEASAEFVAAIRKWTTQNRKLLIFDEVISFRMGYAGAAEWYDATPDLTAMGKIIGGGFPVGALAGKDEFMIAMDPSQSTLPYPQSGTFSANPITMTAGLATMEAFDRAAVTAINELGDYARGRLNDAITNSDAAACVTGAGSMLRIHLRASAPVNYRDTYQDAEETSRIRSLVRLLYEDGFILMNTCTAVLSTAISRAEIDRLADSLESALRKIDSTRISQTGA